MQDLDARFPSNVFIGGYEHDNVQELFNLRS